MRQTFSAGDRVMRADVDAASINAYRALRGTVLYVYPDTPAVRVGWDGESIRGDGGRWDGEFRRVRDLAPATTPRKVAEFVAHYGTWHAQKPLEVYADVLPTGGAMWWVIDDAERLQVHASQRLETRAAAIEASKEWIDDPERRFAIDEE